jgi:hypothetical protein
VPFLGKPGRGCQPAVAGAYYHDIIIEHTASPLWKYFKKNFAQPSPFTHFVMPAQAGIPAGLQTKRFFTRSGNGFFQRPSIVKPFGPVKENQVLMIIPLASVMPCFPVLSTQSVGIF